MCTLDANGLPKLELNAGEVENMYIENRTNANIMIMMMLMIVVLG